jgi:hypothetical protein
MAELVWDEAGERRYETGVDRGVLYHPLAGAIAWNGLIGVTDNTSRESQSYFLDGMKYLEQQKPHPYSGSLSAFTYPDELDWLLGVVEPHPGARVHDQVARPFHLSYRTKVGNDTEGVNHGYKLHVIYNVLANPADSSIGTIGDNAEATAFQWDLTAVQIQLPLHRPTSHISFDTGRIDPAKLAAIEAEIYTAGAALPSMEDLLAMAA